MNSNTKMYFDGAPQAASLFFTSDDYAFFTEDTARDHAKRLTDKAVVNVTRAEFDAWEAGGGLTPALSEGEGGVAPVVVAPEVVLTPLERAEKAVADANLVVINTKKDLDAAVVAQTTAEAAKEAGYATAVGAAKTALTKGITNAKKAVGDAQAAYDNALVDQTTANEALVALTTPA